MKMNRKIQLTAAAVIANGALALGLLSPSPAFATTCGPYDTCISNVTCNNVQANAYLCKSFRPGCTYLGNICTYNGCVGSQEHLTCYYQ